MSGEEERSTPALAATIEAQHDQGKLTARERLEVLLDAGSFREEGSGIAVATGRGRIDGRTVHVISQDATRGRGTLGAAEARRICTTLDTAAAEGSPVLELYDSEGMRFEEGLEALSGQAEILRRQVAAAPLRIAVLMGPCRGAGAFGPASADITMAVRRTGTLVVTGPEVVEAVTGDVLDQGELGGAAVHAESSGAVDVVAETDMDALAEVRRLVTFLPLDGSPSRQPPHDPADRVEPGLDTLIPDDPDAPYDMRELVEKLADKGEVFELGAGITRNLITVFARVDGRPVGIVANQPGEIAGCLDIAALAKARRFVSLCGRLGVPLVTLVDSPGFLPDRAQEAGGIAARGADLARAYATAPGPKITIVTRKAYGGAYTLMAPRALGADPVLAWPTARIGPIGPRGATDLEDDGPHEMRTRSYEDNVLMPAAARDAGLVQDIIAPRETRARLAVAVRDTAPT